MTSLSIIPRIASLAQRLSPIRWRTPAHRSRSLPASLHQLAWQRDRLPTWVTTSPVVTRYLDLLGPLAWDEFPERALSHPAHERVIPYAAFAAACLVRLEEGFVTMGHLRRYLIEHPALMWVLGFPLVASREFPWGFDAAASLPTRRHLTRLLRTMPNQALQFLLDSTVGLIQAELAAVGVRLGEHISLDTKHIIAWVKENNPKAYVSDRYNKDKQPRGDPDCRLGCKRRHNQRSFADESPPTPTREPVPAHAISLGEYYWGYASGVVATKAGDWGEIIVAEITRPFNQSDLSYFFPLMAQVERRLGYRPPYGAFDAAFDAFYVYEYFHQAGGFAAVPFARRGSRRGRQFDESGLPMCPAGLPMPLRYTFTNRQTLVEHEQGRHACPLLFPEATGQACPINHKRWSKGGCVTTLATSIGARIRYQLDREGEAYKEVYRQRTATERINSQAVALGIERPKVRNSRAVANLNTLIYVLLNLRTLQRIRHRKAQRSTDTP